MVRLSRLSIYRTKEYRLGDVELLLPRDHPLPLYQKNFPNYDVFLGNLVNMLPADSLVIDVGANCGDSVALMSSSRSDIVYMCIEPDKGFSYFLDINVERIRRRYSAVRINIYHELVGSLEGTAGCLATAKGTASVVNSKGSKDPLLYKTLDNIVKMGNSSPRRAVSLIKVDTDGWDYDVLNSGFGTIDEHKPLLFFEADIRSEEILGKYKDTLCRLDSAGYSHWHIFDNFGDYIMKVDNHEHLIDLLRWVMRSQERAAKNRSIYYVDILCCCQRDSGLASQSILNYLNAHSSKVYA